MRASAIPSNEAFGSQLHQKLTRSPLRPRPPHSSFPWMRPSKTLSLVKVVLSEGPAGGAGLGRGAPMSAALGGQGMKGMVGGGRGRGVRMYKGRGGA
jgi:hypothetical protein